MYGKRHGEHSGPPTVSCSDEDAAASTASIPYTDKSSDHQ